VPSRNSHSSFQWGYTWWGDRAVAIGCSNDSIRASETSQWGNTLNSTQSITRIEHRRCRRARVMRTYLTRHIGSFSASL